MAKFDAGQVADVLAIRQTVFDWADELDISNGLSMKERGCLTPDVQYFVGGEWRNGIDEVVGFYKGRMAAQEEAGAIMVMRHFITNERVTFTSDSHAKIDYLLLFFAKAGEAPFMGYCDPLATADVWMECSKDANGEWRISKFNSVQTFIRG